MPWSLFVAGVSRAAASLVVNGPLLGKAYFPRAYLPISAVTTAVLDLALSIPALGIVLVATGVGLRPGLLICVVPLSIAAFLAFGLGLLLAALTVRYRDVLQALPFILQLAMFATPVVYPASLIPERHRALLVLNPMAAVVEGTRDCALGRAFATGPMVAAIFVGLALLAVGLVAFQAAERVAADGL